MPTVHELSQFYPAHYHSFGAKSLVSGIRNRVRLKRLMPFITAHKTIVLDYGCGDGTFIKEAAKRTTGVGFWGYEIASRKERSVWADGRVTIIRGSPDDLMQELPPCDLISMNHVIEHLPDPLGVLLGLHGRLNRGGILEGQTPAADSLERTIFGTAWSGFHAPRHTIVFSRRGLAEIIQRAHFDQPVITWAFNPAGLAVSLASLLQGNKPGVIKRSGLAWLTYLAIATALYPVDLLSGAPGIIDYVATKTTDGATRRS